LEKQFPTGLTFSSIRFIIIANIFLSLFIRRIILFVLMFLSMLIVGLVGGIGSGKSTVAKMFCQLGAKRIDADQIGHEILQRPDIQTAARNRWGNSIFDTNTKLNRKALAQIVFNPSENGREELRFLNFLVHPLITQQIENQIRQLSESGCCFLILDAPLLLENHWEQKIDYLIFVDAPRSIRFARTQQRGWTLADLDAREKTQFDLEKKQRMANGIINNSGNLDETLDHVKKIWQNLQNLNQQ
jgi:dephospho-CoA kinase